MLILVEIVLIATDWLTPLLLMNFNVFNNLTSLFVNSAITKFPGLCSQLPLDVLGMS